MCHPECQWACNNPECLAECKIVTEDPVCVCLSDPNFVMNCHVECAEDQCESDACPECQVQCDPGCDTPSCEQLSATWACRKPLDCPQPICQLQCEQPACAYTGTEDVWKKKEDGWPWYLIVFIILYVLALFRK